MAKVHTVVNLDVVHLKVAKVMVHVLDTANVMVTGTTATIRTATSFAHVANTRKRN